MASPMSHTRATYQDGVVNGNVGASTGSRNRGCDPTVDGPRMGPMFRVSLGSCSGSMVLSLSLVWIGD